MVGLDVQYVKQGNFMTNYIQQRIKTYPTIYKTERDVIQSLCCVLGNGVDIDIKGYIDSSSDYEFIITEPIAPLQSIYPLSLNSKEKYHMRLAGCTNKGWPAAVQYLIDCINISPNTVRDIEPWKDNIHLLEELRDHPSIVNKYATKELATLSFKEDLEKSLETTATRCSYNSPHDSVRKVYFFDVQWSDCPLFVYEEVKQLWRYMSLGNDDYMYKTKLDDSLFENYPRIYLWLKHKSVQENEEVIIHWWW